MAATRWEYRTEILHAPHGEVGDDDRERLAALGADGWEAVGFSPSRAVGHGLREVETTAYLVLLKRPRAPGRRRS